MNELLPVYLSQVSELIRRLNGDLVLRGGALDGEWTHAMDTLHQDLERMRQMTSEQLDSALTRQRTQLARLGELYLQMSREPDR